MDDLYRDFEETGYRIVQEENITGGVVRSMNLLGEKNRKLVTRTVPWWARAAFYNFAGIPGTGNYNRLQLDKAVYLRMVLQKI